MQLKLKRSQRESGVVSKSVIFCLDARVEFTEVERQNLYRYKLHSQTIYNSDASKRLLDKADAQRDGSAMGGVKSLMSVAMAALKLNITVATLERGQHVECKSMDELLGAEEALMIACENLKVYLDTATTFDGREVVVDFATGSPVIVARATTPEPMLVAPPPANVLDAPQAAPMALEYQAEPMQQQAMHPYAGADVDTDTQKPWNEHPAFYAAGGLFALYLLYNVMT